MALAALLAPSGSAVENAPQVHAFSGRVTTELQESRPMGKYDPLHDRLRETKAGN
jgi:hypothetical protein